MSTETERMSLSLQTSLRRYLERYPEAADNLQGIRQWWLTPALRMTSIEMLRDVLMVLVAQGEKEMSVALAPLNSVPLSPIPRP